MAVGTVRRSKGDYDSRALWETGTLLRIVLYGPANQRSGLGEGLDAGSKKWRKVPT